MSDTHTISHAGGSDLPPWWFRFGARIRGAATVLGFLGIAVGLIAIAVVPDLSPALILLLCVGGFAALLVGLGLTLAPGAPRIAARTIAIPVRGRWTVMNGPTDRVPSHGTHGHGQTFALDLVYEPHEGARPEFGKGAAFRPPEEFPAFGEDILSPVDGTVIAVSDGARDHRTRSTWPAVGYMFLESFVRELAGSRHVLGNNAVIDAGDGSYMVLAHLQRGSAQVKEGDRVRAGDVVGRCGNSGNSSEPHLHFQLMDHPRALIAAGLPLRFRSSDGVPANGEALVG
jgi:murein DD-endopeptidase MepM/ murein hydrolase activator NlpD